MLNSLKGIYHLIGFTLVFLCMFHITNYKFNYYKEQDYVLDGPTAKQIEQRLSCLALNIYREAGKEPFEGKVAVAQVTLNRSNDPRFPSDICAVVYQKNIIMEKVVCQFSWYCDNAARARPINNEAYKESYEVAKKVLLEGFRLEVVQNALYFHAVHINPNWKHLRVAKIGNHIFYNERQR
jgi:spore germination cell wall hydrolase CwlJ-like protein